MLNYRKNRERKTVLTWEVPSTIMPFCLTQEYTFTVTMQRETVCENVSESQDSKSVATWVH